MSGLIFKICPRCRQKEGFFDYSNKVFRCLNDFCSTEYFCSKSNCGGGIFIDTCPDCGGTIFILDKEEIGKIVNSDCFVTSACVDYFGLADDCAELTILRSVRQNVVYPSEYTGDILQEYRRVSELVIGKIELHSAPRKKELYCGVLEHIVRRSCSLAYPNKPIEAFNFYEKSVQNLLTRLNESY